MNDRTRFPFAHEQKLILGGENKWLDCTEKIVANGQSEKKKREKNGIKKFRNQPF